MTSSSPFLQWSNWRKHFFFFSEKKKSPWWALVFLLSGGGASDVAVRDFYSLVLAPDESWATTTRWEWQRLPKKRRRRDAQLLRLHHFPRAIIIYTRLYAVDTRAGRTRIRNIQKMDKKKKKKKTCFTAADKTHSAARALKKIGNLQS